MKYCLPYGCGDSHIEKEVDELLIGYNENVKDAVERVIEKNLLSSARLIFVVDNIAKFLANDDYKFFIGLADKYKRDFALSFTRDTEELRPIYEELKKANIQFFFNSYVRDWDTLHYYMELGVSDVYVVEALAFELNLLAPVAHAKGVSIRAFANVCQGLQVGGNPLKSFFIRPEDVVDYEKYIDVLEFYGDEHVQAVAYKVYAHDKQWAGSLNEIIIGLEQEIDNRRIAPAFGNLRMRCGKRCLKGKNCHICDHIKNVANKLEESDMFFRLKQK